MKTLKQLYKTREGAEKRAASENALARFEYERGYKARHYRYTVVNDSGIWLVARLLHDTAQ